MHAHTILDNFFQKHVNQASMDALTPSYIFEIVEGGPIDPQSIIEGLVAKWMKGETKLGANVYFGPVEDNLPHGFGVNFS